MLVSATCNDPATFVSPADPLAVIVSFALLVNLQFVKVSEPLPPVRVALTCVSVTVGATLAWPVKAIVPPPSQASVRVIEAEVPVKLNWPPPKP